MRRTSLTVSDEERMKVEALASSRTAQARLVDRARIVVRSLNGELGCEIAKEMRIRPNTVSYWLKRFASEDVRGLYDRPRPGKPATYGEEFRNQVLEVLELEPPTGQAAWDGPAIAKHLNTSVHAVWRVLKKEGIVLSRQRTWCVSTDPEFAAKAADIVGLYLNPPENALVICVDEKSDIQAIERLTGYVKTSSGKIVRDLKSTYKRHGTLDLFAALKVATGAAHAKITKQKRRVEFLEFMDELAEGLPPHKEIHVILGNYCIHKGNGDWLRRHPNVFFHFTPTYASWLNQIEIWFGILSRKALKGTNFRSTEDLRKSIEEFVAVYEEGAKPFVWRKREVKGSQLRNTIVNLCN